MTYAYTIHPSPVGKLKLVANDAGLVAILWENDREDRVPLGAMTERADHPVLVEAMRQLDDYFAGQRRQFDLPLDFHGTDFQKSVWAALLTIPPGETRSYAQIAAQIGRPSACRAVGGRKRQEPDLDCRPLPPRDRQRRVADGVCGWIGRKEVPAGTGATVSPSPSGEGMGQSQAIVFARRPPPPSPPLKRRG